jgi:hypothetical protein
MQVWEFVGHLDSPYADQSFTGKGVDERSALLSILKAGISADYTGPHGGAYHGHIPFSGFIALEEKPGILGGKGGWEATYAWGERRAALWFHRGRLVETILTGDENPLIV